MILVLQTRSQGKDTQGSRLVASCIVFWKKLYCFEEDLWWSTFQNPPSIQWCSKLNTGGLLEDSDVDHSFEILSTIKKKMLVLFALADEENIYHRDGQKKKVFYVLSMCISKAFTKRPYSSAVVLFDEGPS